MAARRKGAKKKAARKIRSAAPKLQQPAPATPSSPPPPRTRDPNRPPLVVVFGAGITGLTVAQELIERGFDVQVVESKPSDESEYEVEVGGLAANQFGVVKADLEVLHPHLFPEVQGEYLAEVCSRAIVDEELRQTLERPKRVPNLLSHLRALHDYPMQPSFPSARLNHSFQYPENQSLSDLHEEKRRLSRFLDGTNTPPAEKRKLKEKFLALQDSHATSNENKFISLARRLAVAIVTRTERLARDIANAAAHHGGELAGKLDDISVRREVLIAELSGYVEPTGDAKLERELGLLRSRFVRELLFDDTPPSGDWLLKPYLEANAKRLEAALGQIYFGAPRPKPVAEFIDEAKLHLVARARENRLPRGSSMVARRRSNRVAVSTVEVRLPGEHGYRFFPAFYRHLFDTMRRTPILDAGGETTLETAFDRLIEPPPVSISMTQPRMSRRIPRRHTGVEELRRSLQFLLQDLKLTGTDLQRFVFRLLVFLTSSRQRRLSYERLSWLEFLDGACEHKPGYEMRHFSERAQKLVGGTVNALLAMDGSEIDAHSYGLNSAQLLLDKGCDGVGDDLTLNGPSSSVWLRPWKEYLIAQGVQFFSGRLMALWKNPESGELEPGALWLGHSGLEPRIPYESAIGRESGLVEDLLELASSKIRLDSLPAPLLPWFPPILSVLATLIPPKPENPDHRYYTQAELRPDLYVLALPFEQAGQIAWRARGLPLEGDWRKLLDFDANHIHRDSAGLDKVQYGPPNAPVYGTWRDRDSGRPLDRSPGDEPPKEPKDPSYPLRDLSGVQFFFANNTRLSQGHVIYPDSPWGLSAISQMALWRVRQPRRGGFLGQFSVDIGHFYSPHRSDRDYALHTTAKTAWRSPRRELPLRVWEQVLSTLEAEHRRALVPPRYCHIDDGIFFAEAAKEGEGLLPATNETPFLINLPGQFAERPGQIRNGDPIEHGRRKPMVVSHEISNGRWVLAGTYMASYTRIMTMEASNESARHAVNAILHDILVSRVNGKYNSQGKLLGSFCDIFDPYDNEVEDFHSLKELDAALAEEGLPHVLEILGFERMLRAAHHRHPIGAVPDLLRRRIDQDWGFLGREMPRMWSPLHPAALFDLLRAGFGTDDLLGRCLELCKGTPVERALRGLIELFAALTGQAPPGPGPLGAPY